MFSHTECALFLESGTVVSLDYARVLVGFGTRTASLIPLEDERPCFYSPAFFLAETEPWHSHAYYCEMPFADLIKALQHWITTQSIKWKNPDKALFEKAFIDLKKRFISNELRKAVPFVFETTDQCMSINCLASSLCYALDYSASHHVHLYGTWNKNNGILGATPEILFSTLQSTRYTLTTMACAGTCDVGTIEQLMTDPKEIHEHQLVVEGICLALKPYGELFPGKRSVLRLSTLAHLITPIEVKLHQETPFKTIVSALHPTPALGAFPKKEGEQWLKNYQTIIDRKRFGAPFGYVFQGESKCLVAIRNVQWDEQGMFIGAGCGVVEESLLDNEWNEILKKISAIKEILHL